MTLDILYEDQDIIVVHKPAGLATQTRRIGEQDLESLLRNHRASGGEDPYIGVVHRLDQPVEGVMVFAKTKAAAGDLSRQVSERILGKHYYALVSAADAEDFADDAFSKEAWTTLENAMVTDKRTNVSRIVPEGTAGSKKAKLEYRLVERQGDRALLDIKLHTGRQHQIRLQLSHMGCPILGDRKYGGADWEKRQLALCSYQLEIQHPSRHEPMTWTIPKEGVGFLTP